MSQLLARKCDTLKEMNASNHANKSCNLVTAHFACHPYGEISNQFCKRQSTHENSVIVSDTITIFQQKPFANPFSDSIHQQKYLIIQQSSGQQKE